VACPSEHVTRGWTQVAVVLEKDKVVVELVTGAPAIVAGSAIAQPAQFELCSSPEAAAAT
jgi:hypothetical protein